LFQNFEDFVVEHFISHAHDIMVACNAYLEGAQMGCSRKFKNFFDRHVIGAI